MMSLPRRGRRPRPEAPELRLLDPAEGAWVAGMLEAGAEAHGGGSVASTVPVGDPAPYEAIVRILHPVSWHHHDWTADAEVRLARIGLVPAETADFRRDPRGTVHAYGTTTWAGVAEDHGTEVHAAAQWADLARMDRLADGQNASISTREPHLEFDDPAQGNLGQPVMAHLAEALLAHTGTPSELVLGLWPGFGWMDGGSSVFGPGVVEATGGRRSSVTMPPAFGPETTRAIRREAALLDVGGLREYLLVPDDGTRLRAPDWPRAVHPDLPEWPESEYQSPQLAWPRDRAWALATEIDVDSTLVAGSAELARAICAHPGIEAVVVRAETDLTAFADTVNHRAPYA